MLQQLESQGEKVNEQHNYVCIIKISTGGKAGAWRNGKTLMKYGQ